MGRGARRAVLLGVVALSLAVGARPAAGGISRLAPSAPSLVATDASLAGRGALLQALRDLRTEPGDREDRREPKPEPNLLVQVEGAMRITSRPGAGRVVGTMPAGSKYYGIPIVAWVIETNGRFGKVAVPYSGSRRTGWISLRGLRTDTTWVSVYVDLSRHLVTVEKRDEVVGRFRTATGSPSSPTPPGRYFVTDRVPFPAGSFYGTFAFGISGIQTRLPAGWSGGNQLAIHGTNSPSTIGRSVSAGCLRVSESALDALKPLMRLGTPVIIRP